MQSCDVAVIGLGAMGAATAYQLARRGRRVIGLDRHRPPHDLGSSHGETRITRCATAEGDAYVALARRSHAIWREIEAATGDVLLDQVGCLVIGDARTAPGEPPGFFARTAAVARRHGIGHELLDRAEVMRRFPAFALREGECGSLEPGGGYLHPERCVAAQLRLAAAHGAVLRLGCEVTGLEPRAGGVRIATVDGPIDAGQAVVAAGAWAGRLLGAPFDACLVPHRQVLHWFPAPAGPAAPMPAFIWSHGATADQHFYGFPPLPGSGEMKVASGQFAVACDADGIDRTVTAGETAAFHARHVTGRLRGVPSSPARAMTCLYTVAPARDFVIGPHPSEPAVTIVSPCSGHGFKHSAAIGEAVAQRVTSGRSDIDLSPFSPARLGAKPSAGSRTPVPAHAADR